MSKSVDIIIGDTHTGSKHGLMYPDPNIDFRPKKGQRWLFAAWETFLDDVGEIIAEHKPDNIHVTFGGDMGDADYKHRSSSYWTNQEYDIVENLGYLLDPLCSIAHDIHWLRGTRSHTGPGSRLDEMIAREWDNTIWNSKKAKMASFYRLDYELSGVLVNEQHYGKNRSKWAHSNMLNALTSEIILERSKPPRIQIPDVAYRHHFHYGGAGSDRLLPQVVAVPSWQLSEDSSYIAEIDAVGRRPVVGGYVGVYEGGKVTHKYPLEYEPPRRKTWRKK